MEDSGSSPLYSKSKSKPELAYTQRKETHRRGKWKLVAKGHFEINKYESSSIEFVITIVSIHIIIVLQHLLSSNKYGTTTYCIKCYSK